MNNFIVSNGTAAVSITNTQEAIERRDDLLQSASHHLAVANPEDAREAAEVLKEIKNFTRMIEASRAEVKAPILELAKHVDGLAKHLTQSLDAEASRIGTNLAAWQTEQNRIAEELKRKAWEEEQRIKREAAEREQAALREAQRAANEAAAEARRVQAELAAKADRARTESGRQKALEDAERARIAAEEQEKVRLAAEAAAAQKREEERTDSIIQTRVDVAAVAPVKQAGVSTKKIHKFEVTDVVALYEACPFMVKLVPNAAVILAAVKNLTEEQHLPGVKHWVEFGSVVR